jgi:hypothetical protein
LLCIIILGNSQEVAAISASREEESVNGDKKYIYDALPGHAFKCAGKASHEDGMLKEIPNAKSEIEFKLRRRLKVERRYHLQKNIKRRSMRPPGNSKNTPSS